jgi:hypothetical protein
MSVSLSELERKILEALYEYYFERFSPGIPLNDLRVQLSAPQNDFNRAFDLLKSKGLAESPHAIAKITVYGIDALEELMLPSEVSKRQAPRLATLEVLKALYEEDTTKAIDTYPLSEQIKYGVGEPLRIRAIVEYFRMKGLADVSAGLGPDCRVKLNGSGYDAVQQYAFDDSVAMANAYAILYKLENHLRRFIESKLRAKYADKWLEQGVGGNIYKSVNSKFEHEKSLGWTLAKTDNIAEYLSFEHLKGIITGGNWKDVFEPTFKDQPKIAHRLDMLEELRNAIGHCRTLSEDSYLRLQQYSQDIYNLTRSIR